jgi:hypothetical protein
LEDHPLHKQAIDWIAQKTNGLNNHYQQHVKIDTFVPDIVVGDELHEVETVNTKEKLKTIHNKKILWVVVPSYEVYNTIRVLGQAEHGGFAIIAENQKPNIKLTITDAEQINKGLNQCRSFEERVYFLRVICRFRNYEIAEKLGVGAMAVNSAVSRLRSRGIEIFDARTIGKSQLEERIARIISKVVVV